MVPGAKHSSLLPYDCVQTKCGPEKGFSISGYCEEEIMKSFRLMVLASVSAVFLLSGCHGHRVGLTFKPWGYLIHADKQYRNKGQAIGDCACEGAPSISRYEEPPVIKIVPKN